MKFLKNILAHQTKSIGLAAFILSFASLLSFLLGLLRDRLLTTRFGAGNELDVYYAAFRIPDFIAMVLMMGAIGVAVVPIFTQNLVKNRETAFKYLANVLNLFSIVLVLTCGILFIFTPHLLSLITPGFSAEKKEITVQMTRIMFLSPVLLGISNIISAILRVFGRFLITALAPIMYNLGSIFGILFLLPKMGLPGLAWGIVFGGFLHLLIQIPSLARIGFKPKNIFNFSDSDFLKTLKLTIPRTVGLAATQINLVIITAIGSGLSAGTIGIFNLANDISSPFIILIAVPFATALFPVLSLAFSKGEKENFKQKFFLVFRQILFLTFPLGIALFILRAQIVRITFGAGKFDWTDTKLTAACFGIFVLTLFAQSLIYLISKAFYAAQNTKTPAVVSIISVALNTFLAYLFVWLLGFQNIFSSFIGGILRIEGMQNLAVIGLPLAVSISALLQFCLLLTLLFKKISDFRIREIFSSAKKIIIASVFLAVSTYMARQFLAVYVDMEKFWGVFCQAIFAGASGFLVYFIIAWLFKLPEIKALKLFVLSQVGFLNGKNKPH